MYVPRCYIHIVTESYMFWTALNGAHEPKICIFERFGVEPEHTCTSSYVKIPCKINIGTFLGILLWHFIAQKIVPKNLKRLHIWSLVKKDPWRQTSPVKDVVALKLAPTVRKSNSEKIEWFEKKKREREKLVTEEGRTKMSDLMIDRLHNI